jgi:hypothetical protein
MRKCTAAAHITLKTEGPSGSVRTTRLRRLIRSATHSGCASGEVLLHLSRLHRSHDTSHSRIETVRERSRSRIGRDTELAARDYVSRAGKEPRQASVKVSEARIEPEGSVLRVMCVTDAQMYSRGRREGQARPKSCTAHNAIGAPRSPSERTRQRSSSGGAHRRIVRVQRRKLHLRAS